MEEEIKDSEKPILQKIADKILTVQQEIDELVVQFALGKAEGKEKFEELKRDFRSKVSEFKKLLESPGYDYLSPETKQKIEALEVQLALGTAESKELFEEQKKKILHALANVETEIKSWASHMKVPDNFSDEVEKFKLKLEIIRLKFMLKKFEVKDAFKDQMSEARIEIDKITTGIKHKLKEGSLKYNDFRNEISHAYKHLRKVVKDLP